MKLYVGVTDQKWYDYLSDQHPDEVNFWSPRDTREFRSLDRYDLFLFKLRSPNNFIVGGGFYASWARLTPSLAWDVFKEKNGAPNEAAFRTSIVRLKDSHLENPEIGCRILTDPFFFRRSDWIQYPKDAAIVLGPGKTYDTERDELGAYFHSEVMTRLPKLNWTLDEVNPYYRSFEGERYGTPIEVVPRLHQGAFRVMVTDAYGRRCAVTGERTLPALDAAHIKPYSKDGPHDPQNGVLLRADLHRLFDDGYVSIKKNDLTLMVSPKIREEFSNGRDYYALQGQSLRVPQAQSLRPSPEFLEWHNDTQFKY